MIQELGGMFEGNRCFIGTVLGRREKVPSACAGISVLITAGRVMLMRLQKQIWISCSNKCMPGASMLMLKTIIQVLSGFAENWACVKREYLKNTFLYLPQAETSDFYGKGTLFQCLLRNFLHTFLRFDSSEHFIRCATVSFAFRNRPYFVWKRF